MQKNLDEPIEYVRGFAEFLGCRIDLSKRPLIPRSETEFWVEQAIKIVGHRMSHNLKVLDIFCGSGCIGLAVQKHVKNAKVDFADIENRSNQEIILSDVFSKITDKYDFIFANPPYIPTKNKSLVQKSVLKYEPHKALFAGPDGMKFINKFLKNAKSYLKNGGAIFMEFDPPQKKLIEILLKKYSAQGGSASGGKYSSWKFNKDQYGKWRWIMIR